MTAAELNAIATTAAAATAAIEQITVQAVQRGALFDRDAPLPPLNIRPTRNLWEPAAVHYRDLEAK